MLTVEGELMHERVHNDEITEARGDKVLSRGMAVSSKKLGINGICDLVELQKDENGIEIVGREGRYKIYPVEYKHGRPGSDDAEELQLCAQAICLEEMLCTDIPKGAVYYGEIKHRKEIEFTPEMRSRVADMVSEMHKYMDRSYTPKVRRSKSCSNCTMMNLCFPDILDGGSARSYIDKIVGEETT